MPLLGEYLDLPGSAVGEVLGDLLTVGNEGRSAAALIDEGGIAAVIHLGSTPRQFHYWCCLRESSEGGQDGGIE